MTAANKGPAPRDVSRSDAIAGVVCLAGSIALVMMAMALPAGHSAGDTGPAALPEQAGIFGTICSALYLMIVMRGAFADERPSFASSLRALATFGIFAVCLTAVGFLGLPVSIALASAFVTLLFTGERRLLRAAATGIGIWLIAVLLFENLLGLPMP